MIVTEAEAASKWCPHARAGAYAGNRDPGVPLTHELTHCIGSRCMFWRWEDSNHPALMMPGTMAAECAGSPRGFCGAAYAVRLP